MIEYIVCQLLVPACALWISFHLGRTWECANIDREASELFYRLRTKLLRELDDKPGELLRYQKSIQQYDSVDDHPVERAWREAYNAGFEAGSLGLLNESEWSDPVEWSRQGERSGESAEGVHVER